MYFYWARQAAAKPPSRSPSAERFNGEIVSCDSVAVYRGMDLGTAKPTSPERARIPHHLIDVADPDQPFTAGEYSRQARAALREIAGRNKLPIVTGGTGLYLRALTEGLFAGPAAPGRSPRPPPAPAPSDTRAPWLHRFSPPRSRHPPLASTPTTHPSSSAPSKSASPRASPCREWSTAARDPLTGFRLLRIGLNPPRAELYDRLNHRCADMFAAGLIEETRALLACYGPVKALDSLGYRQAQSVLLKGVSERTAIAEAQQGHRNYAKRQLTWFRREPDVHWIEAFGDDPETHRIAADLVQANR